jgi:hypothetical protein
VLVREIERVPRKLDTAICFRLDEVGVVVACGTQKYQYYAHTLGCARPSAQIEILNQVRYAGVSEQRGNIRTISQRRSLETLGRSAILSAGCIDAEVAACLVSNLTCGRSKVRQDFAIRQNSHFGMNGAPVQCDVDTSYNTDPTYDCQFS